ncbi:hypothetical protein [Spartinivicinus ruber]|uniref:hypothetical protein n=1 Tax=Spartinivicinus ruber TaxID=2683272 RepID=UPI0013D281B1|nr:hypothetical protein [Spartinivicinus ruber]
MKLDAVKYSDQSEIYNNGKKTIISQKKHFVALAPYQEIYYSNTKTSFVLFIQNMGEYPVTVSPDNVQVTFINNTPGQPQKNVKVQSYNEIMLEIEAEEARQRQAAAWTAIAGALNALSAATSTSTTYSSGTGYGSYNSNSYGTYANTPYSINTLGNVSGNYSGYSTTTTYDPTKAQILANQNNQNFRNNLNNIAIQAQSSRQFVEELVMQTQTIMPGGSHGGLVVTDTRDMNHKIEGAFQVVVTVDKEEHNFTINRKYHNNQQ